MQFKIIYDQNILQKGATWTLCRIAPSVSNLFFCATTVHPSQWKYREVPKNFQLVVKIRVSRLKPLPFLSRSSKWRLRDDKSHDAESRNRECQLRRRSCDERAFSIDAFLFIYFWFWIHTASAPSTARTSTGGGAEIRKPWSASFEGTPAIHVSTLFGSRHSHSQIYKQTKNRTQHTSMKTDWFWFLTFHSIHQELALLLWFILLKIKS